VVLHHVGSIRGVAAHRDGYIVTAGDDGRLFYGVRGPGNRSVVHRIAMWSTIAHSALTDSIW
jgi:hypothetical protein